jgi:Glycosyltransferase family 28 C-terminal domain
VWIAASGDQKALLQEEFPLLPFVEIPGYGVKYGKNRASTLYRLIRSVPKILIRIKREKEWLKAFLALEKPDAVIADNRYGLFAPGLYSILITHQLAIRTSLGRIADLLLQRAYYRMINRFSCCWVPDFKGSQDGDFEAGHGDRRSEPQSLAGSLSRPRKLPAIPTRYIGLLSRFENPAASPSGAEIAAPNGAQSAPSSCDLLVLLSGPEPQRTILEQLLLAQLTSYPGSVILVRGLPGSQSIGPRVPDGIRVNNHLPARELNEVMSGAGMVISRAGYSTVMDLVKLGKKAILVPTPGQTEQEYLGEYLCGKKVALLAHQSGFSLDDALSRAAHFPFVRIGTGEAGLLAKEVRAFLKCIATGQDELPPMGGAN